MSVVDGQQVNAAVTNAAFMSRNSDTSTTGKVNLLNADVASGDVITNVQLAINELAFTAYSTQTIGAGGTINIQDYKGLQYRPLVGDTGAQDASLTPFGNTFNLNTGTCIVLAGTSSTDTVKISHNDSDYGCLLFGDATLEDGFLITLIWDGNRLRWLEQSRNF